MSEQLSNEITYHEDCDEIWIQKFQLGISVKYHFIWFVNEEVKYTQSISSDWFTYKELQLELSKFANYISGWEKPIRTIPDMSGMTMGYKKPFKLQRLQDW